MAITVGTPATGRGGTVENNNMPFDYTVPEGTKFLVYGVLCQFSGGSGGHDTCNWEGEAMTILRHHAPTVRTMSIWGLVNPTAGAGTITVHHTFSTSPATAPFHWAVDLQGDFFSVARSLGDTKISQDDNPSIEYTASALAGIVFDSFWANSQASPGAGQTAIHDNLDTAGFGRIGVSYKAHSGSNPTLSYTGATSAVYGGAEIIESFAPPPTDAFLL